MDTVRNLLIASTSTVFGKLYLEYLKDEIESHFSQCEEILFIPYARPGGIDYDDYTAKAGAFFDKIGIQLKGIHLADNPVKAISSARGIFTGGGNTFLLLKALYDQGLIEILRERLHLGIPYLGTSAGSNILGMTIKTTNDMPIVYPPSFESLGMVPFNINPHYIDPDPDSRHMGETRETRILEYLHCNDIPVVGLREGSYLKVNAHEIALRGPFSARIFINGKTPVEISPSDDLGFLLNPKD